MARLLFFGKLQDAAGARERSMPLPEGVAVIADLVSALEASEPALGAALRDGAVRYVVNEQFAGADAAITDDDEIAFLPPVSGG